MSSPDAAAESTQQRRASKDTAHIGYISLFTREDCIRPMLYVPRDRNNAFAARKPFWMIQLLDQRRQYPNAARKKERAMATNANASIWSTVPLGLFHISLS